MRRPRAAGAAVSSLFFNMSVHILHDSAAGQAVLILNGRALEVVFEGSRSCGLDAQEVAALFVSRCCWRGLDLEQMVAAQNLQDAVNEFHAELGAAAAAARRRGSRPDENVIQAALRGDLTQYLAALDRVATIGDRNAEAVFQFALEENKWAIDVALEDTIGVVGARGGERL